MYRVVFKTLKGKYTGDITKAAFNDKATFESWHQETKDQFEVIEEGVTEERANELCPMKEDPLLLVHFPR